MSRKTDDGATFRRAALLLQAKRMLTAHALAEENVVYPLLRNDAQHQAATDMLYREHAEMKILMFELDTLPKSDPGWLEKLRSLHHLVAHHADEEEQNEFPILRDRLKEISLPQLMGNVQREKSFIL